MMNAISVKNISKQYSLGSESLSGKSFREMILGSLIAPFQKHQRLKGTSKTQEKFWALDDVSFDIDVGEIVGVIGRNGAGKSTLLKILSRITTPTIGTITYRGRMASLLEVGTGFHPELTGRENIFLNGAILGMTKRQITEKLDDIVEFAEISKFLDTPVKRYSSGMYVRLAFSVAAHLDPDILIIDEVLAVGDLTFQQKCLGKLHDVANQGRTVIFVSHNLSAVKNLCSRIIYIKDGSIVSDGKPEAVIGNYLSSNKSSGPIWSDESGELQFLKEVSVIGADNSSNNHVQYTESATIQIALKSKLLLGGIVAVRLTDVFGNIIFTSWDRDGLAKQDMVDTSSKSRTCAIPKELLKPGEYTVTVFVRAEGSNRRQILEEANLSMCVSAEQCPIDEGRLGLIAPNLAWGINGLTLKSK